MSHPRSDWNLLRTALVGVVLLAALFALVANWKRLPIVGADTATYAAEFADASGLVAGEEVRVAGVTVGKVTDLRLERGKVVVTFEVSDVEVGDRTKASIQIKTLLGQHYLSLEPDGRALDDGERIPLARTTTPVNIVPAFDQLAQRTADLDTDKLSAAFQSLAAVLDKTAPELKPALRGLSRISAVVNERDDEIRDVLANAREASGVVADRDKDLERLLTSANEVVGVLDRRRETLTRLIDGTVLLATQLRGLADENDKAVRGALTRLDAVLKVLRANNAQIDEIVVNTIAYARSFTSVGGTGHWFDSTIRIPRGFGVCVQGDQSQLDELLSAVLTPINQQVNGSAQPCLPLGPAVEGTP